MTATNLDGADLRGALYGGVINEDVMQKIWQIDNVPLPFTDLISKGTHSAERCDWTEATLAAPVTNNAMIDGADTAANNTRLTTRLGNFTQTSAKVVQLSHTAQAVNSIGSVGKLAWQVSQRQIELRRDVEAQMLALSASLAGDGTTTAGLSASFASQLKSNVKVGATGVIGGFNTTTGLFVAPTPGTKRALTETLIRDVLQDIYVAGGNTDCLMARPPVIRKLSEYLFSSTARVATLTAEQSQASPRALTAYGSVNVFVTDFGQTVKMIDNRIQAVDAAATSSMYFVDPSHITQSFLRGYQVEPLAKTGLADKRLMSCEYSLKVYSEKSQGVIMAIDEAVDVTA